MNYEEAKNLFENIISAGLWLYRNCQDSKKPQDRVRFSGCHSTWIDDRVKIGDGTLIFPGCCILGNTIIGKRCVIWPNTTLVNTVIADNASVGIPVIKNSLPANFES
jgi:bifunctional N-acetylglucosamine-1-phosphate-uridyltransferase/glucosamine-1-phosphate-acetyltransferase GlmU-like protein